MSDDDGEDLHQALDRSATLRTRVLERMDVLGLNPFSAAKKAGLGADYVRDIIRGRVKHPTAERLGKLAEALETSLQYLLGQEDIQGARRDDAGNPVAPPAPLPSASDPAGKHVALLPIRFELMADTFRRATEVARKPLGYEAATVPVAYQSRQCWWELVRDDSMKPFIAPGSLVQVVEMQDHERDAIEDGDIIVIQKRLVEESRASYHLVERSLRIVSARYPDLGLWFMEYGNEDWGISDDVFKEDEAAAEKRAAKREARLPEIMRDVEADPPPAIHGKHYEIKSDTTLEELLSEGMDPEQAHRAIKTRDFINRMDDVMADPERFQQEMDHIRRRRPKLVGKVIRVLVPTDDRAKFGISPEY